MSHSQRLAELQPWVECARSFSGWDHSSLDIRNLDGPLPWDYQAVARALASAASRVLDLGTGGGERFSEVAAGSHARFVATEEWGVNARVAGKRLSPAGIGLAWCSSLALPFAFRSFDLVLSRHEAIDPGEVDRVLAAGGTLLTQQVTPGSWPELRPFFPRMTVFPDHRTEYPAAFRAKGYTVDAREHGSRVAFGSLGDLVFILLTAPWTIPGFDPESDIEALLALETAHGTTSGIVLTEGHYLLSAVKPAPTAPGLATPATGRPSVNP